MSNPAYLDQTKWIADVQKHMAAGTEFGTGYTVQGEVVTKSRYVDVQRGCYGWMAINFSDDTTTVNNILLAPFLTAGQPGAAFGVLDIFRVYTGRIQVTFGNAATVFSCNIIQIWRTNAKQ